MTIFQGIHHFASVVLLAVAALFPIVDPLGGAPIYLAMVSSLSPPDRARTARLVSINSFFLLTVSVLIGAYVLDIFGVSIPAVQVGGGRFLGEVFANPATTTVTLDLLVLGVATVVFVVVEASRLGLRRPWLWAVAAVPVPGALLVPL